MDEAVIIENIYRSTRVAMPEIGELVGVMIRTPQGDAEVVGEVIASYWQSRRFSVKLINVAQNQVEYLGMTKVLDANVEM